MGDFRQGGRGRFGGDRGDRRGSFGNRGGFDRGPVSMHKVTCDQCKKPCEVPFRPTAGKPVYCNACFGGKKEGGNNRGDFPRKDFSNYKTPAKVDFGNDINKVTGAEIKKLLESLNSKMDLLVKTLGGAGVKKQVVDEKTEDVAIEAPVVKVKKTTKKVSKKK